MDQLGDLGRALLVGGICAFIVSIPVGPVNLTVINTALRNGFLRAFLTGLGAVSAETVFVIALLAGHLTILDKPVASQILRIVAVVLMAGVGVRSLLFKEEKFEARHEAIIAKVDERWHHPRAFIFGFLLSISNLMLVVMWAALVNLFFAREWVTTDLADRLACAIGVLSGGATWFFLLSFFVSRAHRRVKPHLLTVLVRTCGVVFLVFAGLLAYHVFVLSTNLHWVDLLHRVS